MAWTTPRDWTNNELVDDAMMDEQISANFNAVSRVLDRDVAVATVVSTTTETTVYSYVVPAGTLSTNRRLRLYLIGELLNNTGGNSTPTLRLKWAGTTLATFAPTLSTSATARQWILEVDINAENATNAQRLRANAYITTAIADGTAGTKAADQVVRNHGMVFDTTGDLTLTITLQHDANSASLSFSAHAVFLELLP